MQVIDEGLTCISKMACKGGKSSKDDRTLDDAQQ